MTAAPDPATAGTISPRGLGPWLFPTTYLPHATEEYCAGETFLVWISRLTGVHFTATAFLWLNAIAMAAMLGAVWLAVRHRVRWLTTTLATVVTINALAHLVGSVATWSYSPGVVTGTLLWLPLGIATLRCTRRDLPRRAFVAGAVFGVVAHAIVSGTVLLC